MWEQKKITKSFQFPFNIGKHSCTILYGLNQVDLRIDNCQFENLYQGRNIDGSGPPGKKASGPARANTSYPSGSKNVSEGWADIRRAKDGVKYDDIPDPYAVSKPSMGEESKSKPLEEAGRHQKSGTVFKKKEKEFFDSDGEEENEDDFEWGNETVSISLIGS